MYNSLGVVCIILGGFLWYQEEKKKDILNVTIGFSMILLLFGAALLAINFHKHINTLSFEKKIDVAWWHYIFII
jgi:tellurite resistance protein TehA-like permease